MKLKPVKQNNNLAEQVMVGAAEVALISGAVALGASLFTDEATREKLSQNLKRFIDKAKDTLENIEQGRDQIASKIQKVLPPSK